MADEPVSAWSEPWTRTLSRWLTRHRTGVTGAAVALLAGVVGLSAVLGVQARANLALADKNTALTDANAKIEARYNLAVEAIKTFHTGVSEDFLLKEKWHPTPCVRCQSCMKLVPSIEAICLL